MTFHLLGLHWAFMVTCLSKSAINPNTRGFVPLYLDRTTNIDCSMFVSFSSNGDSICILTCRRILLLFLFFSRSTIRRSRYTTYKGCCSLIITTWRVFNSWETAQRLPTSAWSTRMRFKVHARLALKHDAASKSSQDTYRLASGSRQELFWWLGSRRENGEGHKPMMLILLSGFLSRYALGAVMVWFRCFPFVSTAMSWGMSMACCLHLERRLMQNVTVKSSARHLDRFA